MGRFKVNFAETEVRGAFEPVPTGWYHCKVTDGEVKQSGENAKNPGAEYINFELTIQEGQFENQKLWSIASLLPHALFTLKGLAVASGRWTEAEVNSQEFDFDIEDFIGADVLVRASKVQKKDKEGKIVEGEYSNDVKGFKPFEGQASATAAASGSSSLLP